MYPSDMALHVWNGQESDPDFLEDVARNVEHWKERAVWLFLLALVIAAFILHS